ncbi:hypothetical protein QQX09_04800 [Demequina sp. SYSU T00192]|uniref:Sulfotransferase family protein n=1 Tax=Demequina litoralis TaxID=3051660 RepID=A0ABT8G855_9MICO|nr:hypothetical protein [Demequina sp. SYSU T00192]MDN4475177.1 hypothetical protein [Demequina sp. SYSU T00192]
MAVVFEGLVYLDPQKTGSTYVEEVLIEVLGQEPVMRNRHGVINQHDPDLLHCISVRDPWAQYLSLYRYGVDRHGGVSKNLRQSGNGAVYDDFGTWLDVVLDPANTALVAGRWGSSGIAPLVGLQTFRYLRLAVSRPFARMATMKTVEDVRAQHAEHKMWDVALRTESLAEDVVGMLDAHRDRLGITMSRDEIEAVAKAHAGANASKSGRVGMDAEHRARIAEREWLLLEEFGYQV